MNIREQAVGTDRSEDTIAAIATAMSEAGIGIIRISGPEAARIGSDLYRSPKALREGRREEIGAWTPGTIRFGYILDENGEVIDEVMLSWMKAPHSYTTRDTVEINTHGGLFVMQRVLELVLSRGARLAQPGEFTKQAFLGGRIDLARAEAVMDLISAQSEFARKTSMSQLRGALSEKVRDLRAEILYELAYIESALDDPENYSLDGYPERLDAILERQTAALGDLLRGARDGRILQEGIRTVILGRPNAGKSSLLNRLAGEERAIVTEIPGTTRDILRERIRLGDLVLLLTDTAGIRSTGDVIEEIGVQRARKAAEEADLLLWILDAAQPLTEEDHEIAGMIRDKMQEGIRCIALMNKQDLEVRLTKEQILAMPELSECAPVVLSCSARTGEGIDALQEAIRDQLHADRIFMNSEVLLTGIRHREAAQEALTALQLVRGSIAAGVSEDFYTIDLMNAYKALGRILGEDVEDDLVEEIFSKFCMGK